MAFIDHTYHASINGKFLPITTPSIAQLPPQSIHRLQESELLSPAPILKKTKPLPSPIFTSSHRVGINGTCVHIDGIISWHYLLYGNDIEKSSMTYP
jgi:hypothetical protein